MRISDWSSDVCSSDLSPLADARGPQPNGACFWAGYSLSVSPTGDVSPCILTQIANPEALLGTLRTDSMDAIIGRASAFRERLEIDGRQSFSLCATARKSVLWGKGVSVRVDLGVARII